MRTLIKITLAAILPLILAGAARANGVDLNIENGDYQTGAVTTSGVDDYRYDSTPGLWLKGGATDTSADFYPWLRIFRPTGTLHSQSYGNYMAIADASGSSTNSYQGTWDGRVANYLGSGAGLYSASEGESSTPVSLSGPRAGGSMIPDVAHAGSVSGGSFDIFNFEGKAGSNFTLYLTASGGYGYAIAINPSGAIPAGGSVVTNSSSSSLIAGANGTWTLYVQKYYDDANTVSHTVKVGGAGVTLPYSGKGDGCPDPLASTSMPINIAVGNMCEVVKDYTTAGVNPLALIRYYNTLSYTRNGYASNLGPNWRHNYDRYIRVVTSTETIVERQDGKMFNFTKPSSTWVPDTDIPYTLSKSGSTWTLTTPDGTVETYTESAGKGTLDSIVYPNGYTQTLAYSTGKLSTVTDSYSRVLTFSYTSDKLTGVTTPDPATLTYGYTTTSGKELLTSVTYNTSSPTTQTYVYGVSKLPFHLTGITDENGNSFASWTYDGAGRALTEQHAGGADLTSVAYNDSNGQRTVTGPLGEELTYSFTTVQNRKKVSQIVRAADSPVAAATRDFTYDGNGFLATAEDWNGNETRWTNNSSGRPTSITEAYGTGVARTTTISYDSNCPWKMETITRTNLVITNNWDNSTCDLLTKTLTDDTGGSTDGNTEVWTYTYSDYGLVATITEPRTDTTITTTFDYTDGALASITNDLSQVTTINTFTDGGYPTQITDPNGVVTDITYDNRMRWLTKTVNASTDEVTTVTRIGSGQLNLVTLPDSSTIDFNYDNAQRLTTITNTAGETINYTLNAMGKPTTVTIKDSGANTKKSYTATYDVLGNMLTLVGAGGANETTSFVYDGMGNRTSTTDANSNVTAQAWDALLRPTTVTDELSKTATSSYNNLDHVTAQTDFLTYSTSYTRDGFGNAIARSSPDSGSWTFGYDENNNLTDITDARSVVSALTYDALNRLTTRTITGYSSENEAFTYDATAGGNKGVGRLTSWTDESGSGSRVYDNFGNILTDTRVIAGQTYTNSYTYDLANRITQIIYPSGRYVNYTYDSSGYLTTVTTKPSAMGGTTTLASSIVHKPFGPIASFTFGNSEAHTRTYSNNYWLTDIDTVYSGTYVQRLDFGYDYAGNLTSITDNVDNTRNETFTVDALNRLYTASGKYGSRTYTYDDNSGRATKVIGGGATHTTTRVANKNRVDNINDGTNQRDFTWTANGNMATDDRAIVGGGSVSNTFGGRDRLESQTVNGNAVTFKVNAFGQRVSKAFSGTTTHYVHDIRGLIITDANGSNGSTITEYVWMEGELLAQIDSGGNIVYVHNSHIGNPQKITNPSRTVVWDQIIEPFGEVYSTPTNTTPTVHRFPGQIFDAENGLHYNNMRDYDPTLGFYAQIDPIGQAGGLNQYAYVGGNPTQAIDPSGLEVELEFDRTAATLTATDVDTGETLTVSPVHSGNGECTNNPACEAKTDEGPIMEGTYLVGQSYPHSADPQHPGDMNWYRLYGDDGKGGYSYREIPVKDPITKQTVMRGLFNLHTGQASDGCVTVQSDDKMGAPTYPSSQQYKKLRDLLDKTKRKRYRDGTDYTGRLRVIDGTKK